MAVQTFGVTAAAVGYEFNGLDLSGLATEIAAWVTQAGAYAEALLRREGYSPDEVAGFGDGDSLYQLAAELVIHRVAARVALSSSLQNTDLADWHRAEAERIEEKIHNIPEALTDEWDRNEQMGSTRTHKYLYGGLRGLDRPAPPTRFRRGMRS